MKKSVLVEMITTAIRYNLFESDELDLDNVSNRKKGQEIGLDSWNGNTDSDDNEFDLDAIPQGKGKKGGNYMADVIKKGKSSASEDNFQEPDFDDDNPNADLEDLESDEAKSIPIQSTMVSYQTDLDADDDIDNDIMDQIENNIGEECFEVDEDGTVYLTIDPTTCSRVLDYLQNDRGVRCVKI